MPVLSKPSNVSTHYYRTYIELEYCFFCDIFLSIKLSSYLLQPHPQNVLPRTYVAPVRLCVIDGTRLVSGEECMFPSLVGHLLER